MKVWNSQSWRDFPARQLPQYLDKNHLLQVEKNLSQLPALVAEDEIINLKNQLASVGRGEKFLLQGGDCAESFAGFRFENILGNYQLLLKMANVLEAEIGKPVVKIGRVAGQFAKPRSADSELKSGVTLPIFRGDIINGFEFDENSRRADPNRMQTAYFQSAATINFLRNQSPFDTTKVFTSHEALLLNYEEALTRKARDNFGGHFGGSAHMLWIGERTRQLDGAHIEFARGLTNPIGLKCGPEMQPDELVQLIKALNPENEAGKIVLIPRMGTKNICRALPALVRRIKTEGLEVVLCCDPMHGNTYTTRSGYKTRSFAEILSEIKAFFEILSHEGLVAGGVHIEMTARPVIECTGGDQQILDEHLSGPGYETLCDPRLNAHQSLELVSHLIRWMSAKALESISIPL